jgi:hypothetical protein
MGPALLHNNPDLASFRLTRRTGLPSVYEHIFAGKYYIMCLQLTTYFEHEKNKEGLHLGRYDKELKEGREDNDNCGSGHGTTTMGYN